MPVLKGYRGETIGRYTVRKGRYYVNAPGYPKRSFSSYYAMTRFLLDYHSPYSRLGRRVKKYFKRRKK